jgi:hypothetical protein
LRRGRAWLLKTKPFTYECAGRGCQTAVTAGTTMRASKLPLTMWAWAAFLMATHSNGISALQLQNQLGLGSYRTAWMLCAKLRRAMVDPERERLGGLVDADETIIVPHQERSGSSWARCWSSAAFVLGAVAPQTRLVTDDWPSYQEIPCPAQRDHARSDGGAHRACPGSIGCCQISNAGSGRVSRTAENQPPHYLDELAFRFNRRWTRHPAFDIRLGIGTRHDRQ